MFLVVAQTNYSFSKSKPLNLFEMLAIQGIWLKLTTDHLDQQIKFNFYDTRLSE